MDSDNDGRESETATDADDESRPDARPEPGENRPEWDVEVETGPELSVGDAVRFTKTISEADVDRFALASGDTNPLHLDESWAAESRFGSRIVHGMLAGSLVSAAVARLPGCIVYLSQDLEFRAPVRLDDRITGVVEVVESLGDDRYRVQTTVEKGEETVIVGEAVVLVDER